MLYDESFENIENMQKYIYHKTPQTNNKNKYGEVFTPSLLVKEMMERLPVNIWTNSKLRWLDPCAGRGIFFIHIFNRLLNGLANEIPDIVKRKRHILENMFVMIEWNKENIYVLKRIFGNKTTIIHADFLTIQFDEKFDIIIENPPYQKPKNASYKGSKGNSTLWDLFIEKSFQLLKEDGIIGAITPSNWRRPQHKLYSLIIPRMIYLHIYSKKKGMELFDGVQTRFDIYLFTKQQQKQPYYPLIIDEQGVKHQNINPIQWSFLPNYHYKLFKKRGVTKKCNRPVIYNSNEYNSAHLSKRKTQKYKYPVVHTITKKGLGIRYSSSKKKHFGVPKVILNFNEKQYPVNDWKGEYGMSQLSFGLPIQTKKEGDRIVDEINTPEFKEIIKASKWGSFQTDHRMFSCIDI